MFCSKRVRYKTISQCPGRLKWTVPSIYLQKRENVVFCTDVLLVFLSQCLSWSDNFPQRRKSLFYDFINNYTLFSAFKCSTLLSFLWQIQKQKEFYWKTSSQAQSRSPTTEQEWCGSAAYSTWLELLSQVEVSSLKSRSRESLRTPRVNGTENTCLHLLNNTQTTSRLYHQTLRCSARLNRLNAGLAFSSGLGPSTVWNSVKPHQKSCRAGQLTAEECSRRQMSSLF